MKYLKALVNIIREYFGGIQLYSTCGASVHKSLRALQCGNLKNESFGIIDFGALYDPTKMFKVTRNIIMEIPMLPPKFGV
jgi:hypothetical protein